MSNERQRQTYYGALNLFTQEFHVYEASAGNGVNTVAYLQWCQTLYPDKQLVVLWDGASYHRGEEMQKFLAQENANLSEADWKITCLRFAPNAPDQNPTEDVWLKGKTHLRKLFALSEEPRPDGRGITTTQAALVQNPPGLDVRCSAGSSPH